MYVSKEEAKKMIDAAPGKIWIDSFNNITYIHTRPREIKKNEGIKIIGLASNVDYQDNDFYGLLCLEGIQDTTHNIKFCTITNICSKSS